MKRRDFIKDATAVTGASLLIPGVLTGCGVRVDTVAQAVAADAMDEALEAMTQFAPLGNHAPMAVESLVTLGRAERSIPFIEKYKRRFNAVHPVAVTAIDDKNWKDALGRGERNLDWVNFFQRELKENEWTKVVDKWTPILSPGLCAAAGHGVIRTCHAVRSMSRRQTDLRRHELAEGLGYWAAYYQPLPESRARKSQNLKVWEAVKKVPILPDDKRRSGSIMDQLRALDDFADFAEVIGYVQVAGKAEALLSELTKTFAGIYITGANSRNDLVLLHAVTATSGIRSLLPYLSPETTQRALIYGWQTAAGLLSISGSRAVEKTANGDKFNKADLIDRAVASANGDKFNKADLIDRAVASNEEHAIKFTETCLREYELNPNPVYLQAATEALGRLPSF